MKKRFLIITVMILAMILTSCGNMSLRSNTTFAKDSSGTLRLQVIYDSTMAKIIENKLPLATLFKEYGFVTSKYVKEGYNVEDFTLNFNNLNELNETLSKNDIATAVLYKKHGLLSNTYDIALSFNSAVLNKIPVIKSEEAISEESYRKYLSQIVFSNSITVPSKIIETNATESVSENTVQWNFRLGQIDENTKMRVVYTTNGILNNKITSIIIISILVIGLVFAFYKFRKKAD